MVSRLPAHHATRPSTIHPENKHSFLPVMKLPSVRKFYLLSLAGALALSAQAQVAISTSSLNDGSVFTVSNSDLFQTSVSSVTAIGGFFPFTGTTLPLLTDGAFGGPNTDGAASEPVAQEHAPHSPVRNIERQSLGMIADQSSRPCSFPNPFRDQPLRKFALRVFIVEDGPALPGVERLLDPFDLHRGERLMKIASRKPAIEPQSRPHRHGAALAVLVEQEQELTRMDQMRPFPQQTLPLPERFPHQIHLSMLEIAQPAMNDASGSAGGSRSEIVALNQQRPLTRPGNLPRDGGTIDATANDYSMEVLPL